jgi:hypothetical protein
MPGSPRRVSGLRGPPGPFSALGSQPANRRPLLLRSDYTLRWQHVDVAQKSLDTPDGESL